jgi:hypothetical protein
MNSVVSLTNLILQQFRNSLGCNCHNGLLLLMLLLLMLSHITFVNVLGIFTFINVSSQG